MQEVPNTDRPFFSVVIVNFNGGDYLQGAVDSLKRQTRQDFELFVVDNASSDTSMETLDVSDLQIVHLMPEVENHGFAKGNNIAAKRSKGEWLVMLNPDAVADESWLEKIADGIERHPKVKMFASAQYSLDEPGIMDGAGDCYHVFGIPWRGGYGRSVSEMPDEGTCFSPCGASAIFHLQTYLDVGGFEEAFFCYCEDVDLGFRLRLQGETCVFLPQAMIHHAGSALSNQVGNFALYHGTRNRFWVFIENMPPVALVCMIIPHLMMTFIIYLKRGCEKEYRKGFSMALNGVGAALRRRQKKQLLRTQSSLQILMQMSWKLGLLFNRADDVKKIK